MDLATLGLVIDKGQVTAADAALAGMGRTGEAAANRIKASFSTLGSQSSNVSVFAQQLSKAADNSTIAAGATQALGNAATISSRGITSLALGLKDVAIYGLESGRTLSVIATGLEALAGPVGLAALGVIGGLVLAFRALTKEQREAKQAYDDYVTSLTKTGPYAIVGRELDAEQDKLRELVAQLASTGGGVKQIADQSAVVARLQAQYDALRASIKGTHDEANRAFELAHNLFTEPATKGLGDTATQFSLVKFQLQQLMPLLERYVTFSQGRNLGALSDQTLVKGSGEEGILPNPGPTAVEGTKKIAENWQSAAASVANVVTLLANGNSEADRFLATLVTGVGQIQDALKEMKEAGKLSATSAVGLIATGVSLFAGAFGESPESRRSREITQENTAALKRLATSLDNTVAGLTGSAYSAGRAGTTALLGAGAGALSFQGSRGLQVGFNSAAANAILVGEGTSLAQLKDLAKSLDITLDTTTARTFIDSLKQLDERLKQIALVSLKSFSGQLDLFNRQLALSGDSSPLGKINAMLRALANGAGGGGTLGNTLGFGGINYNSAQGRAQALAFLQAQLGKAQAGTLSTEDLGGLTVQQYLDFISQFGDLLNQANQQIQATIDGLKTFSDSLKLDQSLTTLSPAQQLATARGQYNDVLSRALAGDQNAANQLPDVARQFLTVSRAFNASSPAYAADFAKVLADTDAVSKIFAGQATSQQNIEKYTGQMANTLADVLDQQQQTVAVLKDGLQQAVDRLDELVTAQAEQTRITKQGLEGATL